MRRAFNPHSYIWLIIIAFLAVCLLYVMGDAQVAQATTMPEYAGYMQEIDFDALKDIEKQYAPSEEIVECDEEENPQVGIPIATWIEHNSETTREATQNTFFNMYSFFDNSLTYAPYNNLGSCAFVSLIQLMSYYDTFYNDDIIPEQYDRNHDFPILTNTTTLKYSAFQNGNTLNYSPGVMRNNCNYINDGDEPTNQEIAAYRQFCINNESIDLQSRLTMEYNKAVASNTNLLFNYSSHIKHYQKILDRFYGEHKVNVKYWYDEEQSTYEEVIKTAIDSGNPVIVHIDKTVNDKTYRHSVVAYDYSSGGIYANFGWNANDTHSRLIGGTNGYQNIYFVATLDFSAFGHKHSDNYKYDDKTYCGCNLDYYLHTTTSYTNSNTPQSFYWMDNSTYHDELYQISFGASETGDFVAVYQTTNNQLTIPATTWQNILNQCPNGVYVQFYQLAGEDIFSAPTIKYIFDTRSDWASSTLNVADYGFPQQYHDENLYLEITKDNHLIKTNRWRCGYIEQQYIVLSSRADAENKAYLEYEFDTDVTRIDMYLTFWSANEFTNQYNATAFVQYFDGTTWHNLIDLYNDVILSTDRTNPNLFTFTFLHGIRKFRIDTTSVYSADRNKGRICIGETTIYYAIP